VHFWSTCSVLFCVICLYYSLFKNFQGFQSLSKNILNFFLDTQSPRSIHSTWLNTWIPLGISALKKPAVFFHPLKWLTLFESLHLLTHIQRVALSPLREENSTWAKNLSFTLFFFLPCLSSFLLLEQNAIDCVIYKEHKLIFSQLWRLKFQVLESGEGFLAASSIEEGTIYSHEGRWKGQEEKEAKHGLL
jgi:hypothetical protein